MQGQHSLCSLCGHRRNLNGTEGERYLIVQSQFQVVKYLSFGLVMHSSRGFHKLFLETCSLCVLQNETVHIFTWLGFCKKTVSSVTDTSVSVVKGRIWLNHIQIKWTCSLTLIPLVLIFHFTPCFATGCYWCWCSVISHLLDASQLCTQSMDRMQTHTEEMLSSLRTHTMSAWKPEIVGAVPHTVSRETGAR